MSQIQVKYYTLSIDNNTEKNKINYRKDKDGNIPKVVNISTNGNTTAGYKEEKDEQGNTTTIDLFLSLTKLSFTRKIYEPGHIVADIQITLPKKDQSAPTFSELKDIFLSKKVALMLNVNTENNPFTLAKNYYIHEITPRYEKNGAATSIYLGLSIYSMDNLMRLDKYSEAFLGRRLCNDIMMLGVEDFALNKEKVQAVVYNLQHLSKNALDGTPVEFMQPYLVQYNETFYDFLVRTANRCGEFLYFEDGKLCAGLNAKRLANVIKITDYSRLTYQSASEGPLTIGLYTHDSRKDKDLDWKTSKTGKGYFNVQQTEDTSDRFPTSLAYNAEVTANEYYMPLVADQFSGGTLDELWHDEAIGKQIVTIVSSILNMTSLFDMAVTLSVNLSTAHIQASCAADTENDENNKVITTYAPMNNDGNKNTAALQAVPFASTDTDTWLTLDYYQKIRNNEESQQRQMVSVDLGTQYQDIQLGSIVQFDNDTRKFVVVQIDMQADQIMTFRAIPANTDTQAYYPPVLPSLPYRQSEAQHAIIVDNKDPNKQGRVRIRYPWQGNSETRKSTFANKQKYYEDTLKPALDRQLKPIKTDLETLTNERAKIGKEEELKKLNDELEELTTELDKLENKPFYKSYLRKKSREDAIKDLKENQIPAKTAEIEKLKSTIDQEALEAKQKEITDKEQEKKKIERSIHQANCEIYFMTLNQEMYEAATPWIRMATPMATQGGGMFFKPEKGDEVLVNFENGNVERPYVVGTLYSKNVVAPKGNRIIKSPNGHIIRMDDPKDGVKFLAGMVPAIKFIQDYHILDALDWKWDNGTFDNHLLGGITLTDAYGLYKISMSSHDRKIAISSPLGDVKIDAFTGITINAPNGNIKITGKNVDITANNRLTLTSGKNIKKGFLGTACLNNGRSIKEKAAVGGAEMINDAINQAFGSILDLSFLRSLVEVILRPVNGTLEIKSNSFLLLEAGGKSAQIPSSAYSSTYNTFNKGLHRLSRNFSSHFNRYKLLEKMIDTISKTDICQKAHKLPKLYNNACKKMLELVVSYAPPAAPGEQPDPEERKTIFHDGHDFVSNKSVDDFVVLCFTKEKFKDLDKDLTWSDPKIKKRYTSIVKDVFNAVHDLRTYCEMMSTKLFAHISWDSKLYKTMDDCVTEAFSDDINEDIPWVKKIKDIKDADDSVKHFNYYVTQNGDVFTANEDNPINNDTLTAQVKQFKRSIIYYLLTDNVGIEACSLFMDKDDDTKKIKIETNSDQGISPEDVKKAAELTKLATLTAQLDEFDHALVTKAAPTKNIEPEDIIKNNDNAWLYFISTLKITDDMENKQSAGSLFFDTLGTTALTNLENKASLDLFNVWSANAKPKILMSDSATTLSFEQSSFGTPELISTLNVKYDKDKSDSNEAKAAAEHLKEILIKLGQ